MASRRQPIDARIWLLAGAGAMAYLWWKSSSLHLPSLPSIDTGAILPGIANQADQVASNQTASQQATMSQLVNADVAIGSTVVNASPLGWASSVIQQAEQWGADLWNRM